MNKTYLTIIFFCGLLLGAIQTKSQDLSLTFTSVTDAKFFVFLNGKLQNENSSGMVKIKGLEEKDYHIRIVIDDPFEVAVTRTIRPNRKYNEYTVRFNAVKERVDLKPAKEKTEESLWLPEEPSSTTVIVEDTSNHKPRYTPIRRNTFEDTTTKKIVTRVKTVIDPNSE